MTGVTAAIGIVPAKTLLFDRSRCRFLAYIFPGIRSAMRFTKAMAARNKRHRFFAGSLVSIQNRNLGAFFGK